MPAITETQTALKHGPVSNIVLIQQMPGQVALAIYSYAFFVEESPGLIPDSPGTRHPVDLDKRDFPVEEAGSNDGSG